MNEIVDPRHVTPTALRDLQLPAFVYRHVVAFEETNVVGNVYFTRHLSWQGRCREMFLKNQAPGVLAEIHGDLRLVTLRVACEYFEELRAFDEIELHMRLEGIDQHRISLRFDYHFAGSQRLVAVGHQAIGCMRARGTEMIPVLPPDELSEALQRYMAT